MADCSVNSCSGAATSDSCGRKWERYYIQPRNRSTAFLLSGLGMSLIALTFAGSGLSPSLVKRCIGDFGLTQFKLLLVQFKILFTSSL